MKLFRKMFGLLLSLCLVCITVVPVMAADAGDTASTAGIYKVRLFPGEQGTIDSKSICNVSCPHGNGSYNISLVEVNGDRTCEITGLHYNDQVSFYPGSTTSASVKKNKYYIKGAHISGREDNSEKAQSPSFPVESDIDYIVTYGIRGDSVAYTVNYEDRAGNRLIDSDVYYGNVGDLAVVAYRYIEGYQPQAYNLGRTLKENAAENIFTFVYTRIGEGGGGGGGEQPVTGGETEEVVEEGGTTGGGAAAGGGAGAGAGAGGGAGAGADAGVEIPDEEVPAGEPQDYINLDDEEVPLGNLADIPVVGDFAVMVFNIPAAAKIVILAGAVAGLGGIWYVTKRRKRKTESEG